jgi:uncharacterized membrane protein YbhN (UPF0104 family)
MTATDSPRRGLTRALLLFKIGATIALFWLLFQNEEFSVGALLAELRRVEFGHLLPWVVFAVVVKLVGIFANVHRWQLLLRGQQLKLSFSFLCGSFFVGRFFGIVTPGTLGLDGFKLYDAIRVTRKPIVCSAVLLIDKVVGFISLASLLVLVFPIAWSLFDSLNASRALLIGTVAALGTSLFFVFLLFPSLSRPLLRFLPGVRLKDFGVRIFEATTAYASHRGLLLRAVLLGTVGHLTTALMYWALLSGMSPADADAPGVITVLFVALLMTSATLVAPTVGGEGVREYSFAMLLEGLVPQTRSVLFGHAGFWIEKGLLGLPGGLVYLLRKSSYDGSVTRADLERVKAEALREVASDPEGEP